MQLTRGLAFAALSFGGVAPVSANSSSESAAASPPASSSTAPAADPGADGAAPAPAPAPVTTGIRGTVLDGTSGVGMPAAEVRTSGLQAVTVATDFDGVFELELVPGTYELTIETPTFEPQRRTVTVVAGKVAVVDVELEPITTGTETIEVTSKVDSKTESAALARRRAASSLVDSLSSQEIGKTADASAGEAVRRVVSVTLTDGRYVALRGLEGRYVSAMLNGVVLPSPEPDRNAVPLDLFPTSLLSSLTVVKSYGAELPGQFGGGALMLETNSFPTTRELRLSASTSASTSTQLTDGLGNAAGGASDFFGFDDGGRGLPSAVPRGAAVRNLDPDRTESIGESFDNTWSAASEQPMPNLALGASLGDSTRLGGKPVGYLGAVGFRRGVTSHRGVARSVLLDGGMLAVEDDLRYLTGEAEATVSALGNASLQLADDHRVQAFGLYTHVGEDVSGQVDGYSARDATGLSTSRLSFVERGLAFSQLSGVHDVPDARALSIDWQANVASTSRDELDTRDIAYNVDQLGVATFRDQPGSGQRFFSLLDETSVGAGANARAIFDATTVRAGASIQAQDRALQSRRFRYEFIGESNAVRQLAPEQMLSAEHIGPDFRLTEATLQEDSYDAALRVMAGYASAEFVPTTQLRLVGGVRVERADQAVSNGTSFAVSGMTYDLERADVDVLPALNLIFAARPDMNFRAAYSATLARPRFRELAPFLFFDYTRRRSVSGNPELETTHIQSGDVRWEWFPGEAEVVAASAFAKHFQQPIEQVITNVSSGDASFRNAPAGDVLGVELEARLGLGRVHPRLGAFRLGANLALMRSSVDLGPDAELLTSAQRPMYAQSPYAVNVALEYRRPAVVDLSLLYNVVGPRISDVGVQGIPDAYEQPQHRLDVVASRSLGRGLRAKASVTNVLDQDQDITQDDIVVSSREPGVGVSLGLEWTP